MLFLFCLISCSPLAVFSQVSPGMGLSNLDRLQEGRRMRASSSDPDWRNGNRDARPIPPGDTLTLGQLRGPGRITHIWCTIAAEDPHYGRSVTLRMYWDGNKEPAVEAPLGDFFACGHGIKATVNSIPVQVSSEGRAYNCFWPMPFKKSARITVSNDSATDKVHAFFWYIDWMQLPGLPENTAYFHAQYRQEFPCRSNTNYLIFNGKGRGHYVGTVLSVHMNGASWFGEGDDFFYIDGETEPSLRGTGTEDYFCDAWGFRTFNNPSYGVTIWEGFEVDDHGTAYRWHLTDPVPFKESLLVTIEHKGVTFHPKTVVTRRPLTIDVLQENDIKDAPVSDRYRYVYTFDGDKVKSGFEERPDYFSSVAFWYQQGKAERFAELPPAHERLVLGETIEGESRYEYAEAVPEEGLEVQKAGHWSGGAQLFYHPPKQETPPRLTVPFEIKEPGRYILKALLTRSWDYGIYSIALDGDEVVKTVDLYSANLKIEKQELGVHTLKSGKHTLTFTAIGVNPASKVLGSGETGRYMGLDGIYLRAVPARSVRRVKAPPPKPEDGKEEKNEATGIK